jgi:hypothetical protein
LSVLRMAGVFPIKQSRFPHSAVANDRNLERKVKLQRHVARR